MTDQTGRLITPDGNAVLDVAEGEIQIPAEASLLQISKDGVLSADGVEFSRLGVVSATETDLTRLGGNNWLSEQGFEPVEFPDVLQGFLEDSNVQPRKFRMNALKIAATGMAAQQTRVDTISNNIANMSTTAYQPRTAEFADLIYQQNLTPGSISSSSGTIVPAGIQIGMGVRPSTVSVEITQGALSSTGGDLDLAIEGRGFFEITLPSGDSAFTRDGKFYRDAEGLVVNSDGYELADNITIPADARRISIGLDGEVTAFFDNETDGQNIGTITMTVFSNPKGLEAMGGNLFRQTAGSGDPIVGEPQMISQLRSRRVKMRATYYKII